MDYELLSYGKTKVKQTELDDFLGIANKLKIKGMKGFTENQKRNDILGREFAKMSIFC